MYLQPVYCAHASITLCAHASITLCAHASITLLSHNCFMHEQTMFFFALSCFLVLCDCTPTLKACTETAQAGACYLVVCIPQVASFTEEAHHVDAFLVREIHGHHSAHVDLVLGCAMLGFNLYHAWCHNLTVFCYCTCTHASS